MVVANVTLKLIKNKLLEVKLLQKIKCPHKMQSFLQRLI